MKRILTIISLLVLLLLAFIYLYIPNKITLSEKLTIAANREAIFRKLSDTIEWHKWWPGKENIDSLQKTFFLNGLYYRLDDKRILSLPVSITSQNFKAYTEVTFITINTDSTIVSVDGIVPTSYNPIKRLQLFFKTQNLKKDVSSLLQSIGSYYSTIEHLYGYEIQKKSVTDSTLVSTFKEIKGYPSTMAIYALIDELKNYIRKQGAAETGYPMLNIFKTDSSNYRVKVAIPVDKKLPSSGNISYKWMLGGGNILITEVHGGNGEVEKAYEQMQNYISDYKRTAPAISFQSLVTDRRQEPDSSKWITRIYYPVM